MRTLKTFASDGLIHLCKQIDTWCKENIEHINVCSVSDPQVKGHQIMVIVMYEVRKEDIDKVT